MACPDAGPVPQWRGPAPPSPAWRRIDGPSSRSRRPTPACPRARRRGSPSPRPTVPVPPAGPPGGQARRQGPRPGARGRPGRPGPPTCRAWSPTRRLVDATLPHGLMPFVVPQLKTITLGGAVTGLGIESIVVPQRPAARVGARDGDAHRRRAGRRGPRRTTSTPTCSAAFPNSYGTLGYALRLHDRARAGQAATCGCATCASTRAEVLLGDARDLRRPARTTASRWTSSTARSSRPDEQYLTVGTFVDEAPYASATTPACDIYYRSIQQRDARLPDRARLPVALGHRLVLVLARVRRAAAAGAPARGRARSALRRVPEAGRVRPAAPAHRAGRPLAAAARRRSRSSRTSRCRSSAAPKFLDFFHREVGIDAGLAVPAAAARRRDLAALPAGAGRALRQRRLLVERCRCRRGQADGYYNRLIEEAVHELGGPQVAVLHRRTTPRRSSGERYNGDAYGAVKRPTTRTGGCSTCTRSASAEREGGDRWDAGASSSSGSSADDAAGARSRAYDGSRAGPARRRGHASRCGRRGAVAYLGQAPGELGLARAYVSGDIEVAGRPLHRC